MERSDELKAPPIVGRFYLVPTVLYPFHEMEREWPIIGPKHADKENLHFPYAHYHLDARFLSERAVRHVFSRTTDESIDAIVGRWPLMHRQTSCHEPWPHPEPIYRKRRCVRAVAGYAHADKETIKGLHAAFAGQPLAQTSCGRVCPHKGARVDSLQPDARGIITGPLHGLRFNFITGESVP